MEDKIIVIVGPTAIGKTDLSIHLAQKFDGEIVNADAMQVYRQMDIGTAKVTTEEAQGIVHHLLDIKYPNESYTVAEFKRDAVKVIAEITQRDHLPIIVGGSGLYTESLLYDVSHGGQAKPNLQLRHHFEELAEEKGKIHLWEQLKQVDPVSAEKIHPNNVRRVIRALEVYHETGVSFSALQNERKTRDLLYDSLIIGLDTERELLYQRINQRVKKMIQSGLVEEVEQIIKKYGKEAQGLKGIGYKEWLPYFADDQSIEETVNDIQKNSRHFAKRQLTWFRNRIPVSLWSDPILDENYLKVIDQHVNNFLKEGCNDSK